MTELTDSSDIWQTSLTEADIQIGIDYGIISRAWTYDRMGAQARGQFGKAIFRIGVGKAAQHCLERLLRQDGVEFVRDTTDFKEEDYWDIRSTRGSSIDVKGFNVFSDYHVEGRGPLNREVIANSSGGENWSSFFPMLIPQDQFDTNRKDCYVFYIIRAPSSKRFSELRQDPKFLITLPHSSEKPVNERYRKAHRRKFADKRVAMGKSFSMEVRALPVDLIQKPFKLTVGFGDSKGESQQANLTLEPGDKGRIKDMTALHYVRLCNSDFVARIGRRNMPLFAATFHGVDDKGELKWEIRCKSFEDIWIYDNQVYFVGWITAEEFDKARRSLPAFGPNSDYDGNGPHNDPDERGLLTRKSFCYYYPPTFRGGTQNWNYYCLPGDLHKMDSLARYLQEK